MSKDFNEGGGDVDFTSYRCSTYRVREKHNVNSSGESPDSFDENSVTYDSYYTETFRPQSRDSDHESSEDIKKRLTECMLTKGRSVSYKEYLLESAKLSRSESDELTGPTVEEVYVNVEENLKGSTTSSDDDESASESEEEEEENDEDIVDKNTEINETEESSITKKLSDMDQTRVYEDTTGASSTVVQVINDNENDEEDDYDSDDCKTYRQFNERNITSKNSPNTTKRYLNPAVYVEDVDAKSVDSNSIASVYSTDHTTIVQSLRSSSTPFMVGKMGSPRHGSGSDTFRLSVTSRSTNATAKEQRERDEEHKRIAFEQWLIKKEQERKEQKRVEMMKNRPTPQTTPEQREESYKRWMQRKKVEAERRRLEESAKRLRKEREHREAMRKEKEKEERLVEWLKQKEEAHKETKGKEEYKRALLAAQQDKRRAAGEQAFRDWLRTSKVKPLPVPLNQGELSMRGTVAELYVNPVEWQPV